jgi:hypothetical protein
MNSMYIFCEFFVVLEYDEINCNIVFGVFYNVLWNANFGYMK